MEGFEDFGEEGKCVGVVFDLSLRHGIDGRRLIDTVKRGLAAALRDTLVDGEDGFYLYHPEVIEVLRENGQMSGALCNYDSDGILFNLAMPLKQTLYVLAAESLSDRKYLILVTDRLQDSAAVQKAVRLSRKEMIDCRFLVIGVGDRYCMETLNSFRGEDVAVRHLLDATLIRDVFKETNDSEDKVCKVDGSFDVHVGSGHCDSVSRSVREVDDVIGQLVSLDQNELLQGLCCGRSVAESGVRPNDGDECQEECRTTSAGESSAGDSH